ncbi:hypothetical protein HDV57DRAFT_388584 [Trichoderma longibrachiatum]
MHAASTHRLARLSLWVLPIEQLPCFSLKIRLPNMDLRFRMHYHLNFFDWRQPDPILKRAICCQYIDSHLFTAIARHKLHCPNWKRHCDGEMKQKQPRRGEAFYSRWSWTWKQMRAESSLCCCHETRFDALFRSLGAFRAGGCWRWYSARVTWRAIVRTFESVTCRARTTFAGQVSDVIAGARRAREQNKVEES